MAKQKWDGNFNEAYWVDRDNPVEELIENSGRILREPTSDGYTHDIVYRAGYISEDYYFPNPARRNGHDHYELHSTGDIVIDGKKITTGGTGTMKHLRMRNISKIEGTQINNEAGENIKKGEQLNELGRDYLGDKAKLEQQYEQIQNDPTLDRSHKLAQLRALREAVVKLQEDYEKEVTEKQEEVQENLETLNEELKAAEAALDAQQDSLQGVQMDVAAVDTSAAAEAAAAEKEKFRQWHAKNVEELNLRIEQQQLQRQEILRDTLSGR